MEGTRLKGNIMAQQTKRFCPGLIILVGAFLLLPAVAMCEVERSYVQAVIPPSETTIDVAGSVISLNGTWKFNPAASADFWKQQADIAGWSNIDVPGEWVMQGFDVAAHAAGGYVRQFDVPKKWAGNQVKLRFDGVFSVAAVYVNGKEVGRHEGGFTPFELDVTEAVRFGLSNTLAVAVTSESLSDTLASASQYAVHPLGGISRKVTLLVVSKVNVKSYHVTTEFDEAFDDATMNVSMKIHNQTDKRLKGAKLEFSLLKWPTRESVQLEKTSMPLPEIAAGQMLDETIEIAVDSPKKWDNEHPNLYVLQCKLINGFETIQTVERRFGFRQVEVRGNELFVNNNPVKLRAVNRHEAHPRRGRSLTMEQWRRDVELFREANCNLIRTSHYPPAEEFVDLCDEFGLFVEEEAALCWVGRGPKWEKRDPQSSDCQEIIVRSALEMVERDRSHPSILFWSLANESEWGPNFESSYESARKCDPSRAFTFHDQNAVGSNNVIIANYHYPTANGPKEFANRERPIWFGEYCHLNVYNRYELWTDPGLRDVWGRGFQSMWDNMYTSKGILGGAIWSGIDDTFHLPGGHTVGYGSWGPIDGWRRLKPEYWHVKKVYSPVRISVDYIEAPASGGSITIPLENRHNFTNIKELDIQWQIGDQKGKATADIAPRTKGEMTIRTNLSDLDGQSVYLQFGSPLGFVVDEYRLPIGKPVPVKEATGGTARTGEIAVKSDARQITIAAGEVVLKLDNQTGLIIEATQDNNRILSGGPELMILPLNSAGNTQMTKDMKPVSFDTAVCSGRKVKSVSVTQNDIAAMVTVADSYDIAQGGYTLTIGADGTMTIDYEYELTGAISPRQYGMVVTYPGGFTKLSWLRKGLWSVYPKDHIARLEGEADAFVGVELSGMAGPVSKPDYAWRHDTNELGTNDFRSTKENIISAHLADSQIRGPVVESDGSEHIRCWVEGDSTRMLIAEYNNPGSDHFVRIHIAAAEKPLKPGDKISGLIRFKIE